MIEQILKIPNLPLTHLDLSQYLNHIERAELVLNALLIQNPKLIYLNLSDSFFFTQ